MRAPPHGALLATLALAWLAGVAAQLRQVALWPWSWVAALLGLAAAAALLSIVGRRHGRRVFAASAVASALFGFGLTAWHAGLRLADALPAALEGRDLVVTGVVASLPQAGAAGLRFRFEIEQATLDGQPMAVPRWASLGWYRYGDEDAAAAALPEVLQAGQRWRFGVRLRQPHGNRNAHGFDYELYLFEQGVRAVGYVRDGPPPQRLDDAAGHSVQRWRQQVRDAIARRVGDPGAAGVLAALAVGDQSAIERDDWELFRQTGVAHLMSISGLHVTMFAWLAGHLVGAAWRRNERAMLHWPAPTAARWGGLAAALGYAVFSGWGVPSQRTVWMLATVTVLQSLGRHWPWPLVLLAAAVVVTLGDPWALLQPGFWLSFTAVALLMTSEAARRPTSPDRDVTAGGWRALATRTARAARGGLRTQCIATVGLTPLSLVFFQQVSLVGFLANLVAIPVVTLVVTPLALLGVLVAPLWTLGAWTVEALGAWLAWLASWPWAVWTVPAAPPWAQLAALLAALLAVLPLPWRLRLLALPLAVPLLWPARTWPDEGRFEIVVVDVGQGSAVLLRTREHLLVYDAGPQYSRDSDAGRRVLLPLLRARGEPRIDVLMLSHRDSDHVGGAVALLATMPVGQVHSSLEEGHAVRAGAVPHRRCEAGQRWRWDGVDFEVLHPRAADHARPLEPNALSCVLRVQGADLSVLLTGDVASGQEAELVAAHGAALQSDLLLVPHHGSRHSSSAAFLDAVRPRMALAQAGYRNRFGHPAPEVVHRHAERGIAWRQSSVCGAWSWAPGDPAEGRCQRDLDRRYWHHGSAPAPSGFAWSPADGP